MPYKVRPLNWNLLLNPSMAGIETEAQASRGFAQSILGAGQSIGGGIAQGRQEKESKRRFDANQADELRRESAANMRADRDFSLREKVHGDAMLEKARERQANEATFLDLVTGASEQAQFEHATTGEVSPGTSLALRQASDALGGPEATQERLTRRASGGSDAEVAASVDPSAWNDGKSYCPT